MKQWLISLVREYSWIYKHDSNDNKDNIMKENTWTEIVKEIYGDHMIHEEKGKKVK